MLKSLKMKYLFFILFSLSFNTIFSQDCTKTKLYIIGTVHQSSDILNPEMLFKVLNDIQPDILLQENDSEQIKTYFEDVMSTSNEQNASLKYLEKYPETLNLPFEFEGRNAYRKSNGMTPTDNLTIKLIDSLYNSNLLSPENNKIFKDYQNANAALIEFSKKGFKALNSIEFDSLNKYRQNIQHRLLTKITESETIFAERFVTKPNGQKISFRDGYKLWCNFWDLRNNSMAINIIRTSYQHKGKKIVVLTGVQHKYYIKELLEKYHDGNYEVIDYFK